MFDKTLRARALRAVVAFAMAAGIALNAQPQPAAPSTPNPLSATLIKTGLYRIAGSAGNSVLRLSANGLILVDGQLSGDYPALLKKMRKIVDQPVRALVLTGPGAERAGTNAEFLEAGARILVHENMKSQISAVKLADGKVAAPPVTYDREYTIRMGGVEARLMHFGNARTNADTIVFFPNLKVVAVGDLYATNPDPDFSAAASIGGWSAALAEILKLDFDVAVPGVGAPVGKPELIAFKAKLDALPAK